jgi:hypothetical protein
MNPPRPALRPVRLPLGLIILSLCCCAVACDIARACLTANIDKRAVQWSTLIVQAKLTSLGDKIDIAGADPATTRPSGRPTAVAYRIVSFEITDVVDGTATPGDTVKALVLIGGQPGDSICPPLLPESVGKKIILLMRPFEQTSLDVPNNTQLTVGQGAMVIVSQLGEADINSETMNDLKAFVTKTRSAPPVNNDQLTAQVETVATAHDDTEASEAEKAIEDIGPDAVPMLDARMKTANDAGKTRIRHLIDDLSPPALSAEPE